MKPRLIILGSGSALPTRSHFPSSQILEIRQKQFMIDCGEGTQIRMRQMGLKVNRLGHIFISHLHGDHCFGLLGLISSFGLLNRTADLHIHGPTGIESLFQSQLQFFCNKLPFQVFFNEFNPREHTRIYHDRSVEVKTIPLLHRVPCAGFLFEEKPTDRHIRREMIDFYKIPYALIPKIKQGEDYVSPEGEVIPNHCLTHEPSKTIRYAYCSDTAYSEKIITIIQGVDLLYHEATFAQSEQLRAAETMHTTAAQAATIAQKAGVKKLLLGHFSARYYNQLRLLKDEAEAIFQPVILAEDMQEYYFD